MAITMKKSEMQFRELIFKLITLVMIATYSIYAVNGYGITTSFATTESTTEVSTEGSASTGDLNDVNVTMDESGNIIISGLEEGDSTSVWNNIFNKYKGAIAGFSGLVMLTFIFFFLKNLAAIGANSNNPTGRREAIMGCLWTGIGAAGSGSVLLLVGLFWNALK